jgi:hypothetical protein
MLGFLGRAGNTLPFPIGGVAGFEMGLLGRYAAGGQHARTLAQMVAVSGTSL